MYILDAEHVTCPNFISLWSLKGIIHWLNIYWEKSLWSTSFDLCSLLLKNLYQEGYSISFQPSAIQPLTVHLTDSMMIYAVGVAVGLVWWWPLFPVPVGCGKLSVGMGKPPEPVGRPVGRVCVFLPVSFVKLKLGVALGSSCRAKTAGVGDGAGKEKLPFAKC